MHSMTLRLVRAGLLWRIVGPSVVKAALAPGLRNLIKAMMEIAPSRRVTKRARQAKAMACSWLATRPRDDSTGAES